MFADIRAGLKRAVSSKRFLRHALHGAVLMVCHQKPTHVFNHQQLWALQPLLGDYQGPLHAINRKMPDSSAFSATFECAPLRNASVLLRTVPAYNGSPVFAIAADQGQLFLKVCLQSGSDAHFAVSAGLKAFQGCFPIFLQRPQAIRPMQPFPPNG
jgi:hypothetical protein